MAYEVMTYVLRDTEGVGLYSFGRCSYCLCVEGHDTFMAYADAVMTYVLRDTEAVGRYIYGLCNYGICAERWGGRRPIQLWPMWLWC